jgi:hypothetical protein
VCGVVIGAVAIGTGTTAEAQQVVGSPVALGETIVVSPDVGPGGPVVGSVAGSTSAPYSPAIMPYSYYVNFPAPSRIYVGYGPNDGFTYQGQAYGHAGDRWSWGAMSTGGGSLARYYYQILR